LGEAEEVAEDRPDPVLQLGPRAPWTGPALGAFAIVVLFLAVGLESAAASQSPDLANVLPAGISERGFSLSERSNSLNVRASMLLLFGAALASALLSIWSLRISARQAKGPVLVVGALFGLAGVAAFVFGAGAETSTASAWQLVTAVERYSASFRNSGLGTLTLLPKYIGEAAAMLLGAGMVSIAALPRRIDSREIALRARRLRNLLYGGAAMFVCGIVVVRTSSTWLLSFFPPAADGTEAAEFASNGAALVSGMANLAGAFYSLMLAAVYLPTAIVLGRLAGRLGETALGEKAAPENIRGWLEERELLLNWRGQLTRVGALLAPVLSSAAVQFFGIAG